MFFFPVLSHSFLQLRIRFFHSPYQVILSYFVFFVPFIFLLLLSYYIRSFLSLLRNFLLSLDAGIVYIFFPLLPSYYIKGLSSLSLSSNSRCLECSNATMHHRCRYTFSSSSSRSYSVRRFPLCPALGGPRYRFVSLPSTPYLSSPERRTRCIRAAFSSLHQENFFWFRFLASCPTLERCNFRRVFFFFFTSFFFRTIGISARAKVTCNQENSIYYIKVELAK